jgi:hypothetical protein
MLFFIFVLFLIIFFSNLGYIAHKIYELLELYQRYRFEKLNNRFVEELEKSL